MSSLLSTPKIMRANALAYELLSQAQNEKDAIQSGKQAFAAVLDNSDSNKKEVVSDIIKELVRINDNMAGINELLMEKSKIMCRLETALNLKRYAKIPLRDIQIAGFSEFMSFYRTTNSNIRETLNKIDQEKNFTAIKDEILHKDCNYKLIYEKLKILNEWQSDVIKQLKEVISAGHDILKVI